MLGALVGVYSFTNCEFHRASGGFLSAGAGVFRPRTAFLPRAADIRESISHYSSKGSSPPTSPTALPFAGSSETVVVDLATNLLKRVVMRDFTTVSVALVAFPLPGRCLRRVLSTGPCNRYRD